MADLSKASERATWTETRLRMAVELARRSLCVRDQVGAVIIDVNGKIIGEGYNGPPSGFWHYNRPCIEWCQRAIDGQQKTVDCTGTKISYLQHDYSDCPALHAEANALMMSDRALRGGGTIYVTSHICIGCAKLVANSGLLNVVVESATQHEHRRSDDSYQFMVRCRLNVIVNGVRIGVK